jgi:hypothetical protein
VSNNPDLETRVTMLLRALVCFDFVLSVWVFAFPQLWFDAFHGVPYVDAEALLPRMGAQWTGFMLCQLLALIRWKREGYWLPLVAGVRICDAFTDLLYVLLAHDTTWFAKLTLPVMGPINVLIGVVLIRAFKLRSGESL